MFSNITWREIWLIPETGRLRCGWRIAAFVLMIFFFYGLLSDFTNLLLSFFPNKLSISPIFRIVQAQSYMLVASFAVGVWALRTFESLTPRTLGLNLEKKTSQQFFLGLSLGLGLILFCCIIAFFAGSFSWTLIAISQNNLYSLLLAIGLCLVVSFSEELSFRGYFFQTMLRGIGVLPTLLFSSIIFAAAHADNSGITLLAYANLGTAGVFLGLLYLRTGSLWAPVGFHLGWNFAQILFDIPVSGASKITTSPFSLIIHDHPWSTLLVGGEFGIEGGLIITVILLAAVAVVARGPWGIPLDSQWWSWPDTATKAEKPVAWDFIIGKSHFQWKLPPHRNDN